MLLDASVTVVEAVCLLIDGSVVAIEGTSLLAGCPPTWKLSDLTSIALLQICGSNWKVIMRLIPF